MDRPCFTGASAMHLRLGKKSIAKKNGAQVAAFQNPLLRHAAQTMLVTAGATRRHQAVSGQQSEMSPLRQVTRDNAGRDLDLFRDDLGAVVASDLHAAVEQFTRISQPPQDRLEEGY